MPSLLEPTTTVGSLLRECPVSDLRRLEVLETEAEVIITGTVPSYYLKQMAQEWIRPALAGRRLRNRVKVMTAK